MILTTNKDSLKPLLLLILVLGTASMLISCKSLFSASRPEPGFVVISNSTAQDLSHVEAKERPRSDRQPARLASVSQLLAGSMFTLQRRAGARSLTDDAMISWEWPDGRKATAVVSVSRAIKTASGQPNEALIFTILPDGKVRVTVDVLP